MYRFVVVAATLVAMASPTLAQPMGPPPGGSHRGGPPVGERPQQGQSPAIDSGARLFISPAGEPFVRVEFVYQSMHQMRHLTTLSLDEPARRVTLSVPECTDGPDAKACRWPAFARRARAALLPACLDGVR